MSQNLALYPFENATMHITQATIIPPIFDVVVTGATGSLNPVIKLVNTHQVADDYLVIEVVGKDGVAIGTTQYSKSIDVSALTELKGVVVKGANKEVTLDWDAPKQLSTKATVGLFPLTLQSESSLLGAPTVNLQLTIDTPNKTVSGLATVSNGSLAKPIVCKSHVTGDFIYETVMSPGESKIRIDVTGHPQIHWPKGGGVGPVIPKNFSAMILLNTDWSEGTIQYEYATGVNEWQKESQAIKSVH